MNFYQDPHDPSILYYPAPRYTLSLDLGRARDWSALAILERHGEGEEAVFHARHLQRFPLGTSYPAVVARVAAMLRRPPLTPEQPRLAVDQTIVGAPVINIFRQADLPATLYPVHITAGSTVNTDSGVEYVPKRDLVSIVQVALQTERLKIADTLPAAPTLVRELQGFQDKSTEAANDTYGAWREGAHDDLVLAVALALYVGKKLGDAVEVGSYSFRTF